MPVTNKSMKQIKRGDHPQLCGPRPLAKRRTAGVTDRRAHSKRRAGSAGSVWLALRKCCGKYSVPNYILSTLIQALPYASISRCKHYWHENFSEQKILYGIIVSYVQRRLTGSLPAQSPP